MRKRILNVEISAVPSSEVAALFLALNAFGYDDENNPRGMSKARRSVRKAFLRADFGRRYPRLRALRGSYHPWALLSAIFFKHPKSAQKILSELRIFSQEGAIRKLLAAEDKIERASARTLFPIFARELENLVSLFGKLPREVGRIVLVPNQLDAYWRGYLVQTGRTAHIVVGPGAERDRGELIRHELLHLFAKRIRLPSSFAARPSRTLAKQGYGSSRVLREEYAVRALGMLYRSRVLKENDPCLPASGGISRRLKKLSHSQFRK